MIKTAELAVSHNDNIIKTNSIGSCVVIALYDSVNSIGGLAHAMLPYKRDAKLDENMYPAKYVDQAIDNLITTIVKAGGKKENLTAKIVGGASMFKKIANKEHGIGDQNSTAAHEYLTAVGIPIEAEDIGGSTGKIAELDLVTGLLNVQTKL